VFNQTVQQSLSTMLEMTEQLKAENEESREKIAELEQREAQAKDALQAAEKLIAALELYGKKEYDAAAEEAEQIDESKLSDAGKEAYQRITERGR